MFFPLFTIFLSFNVFNLFSTSQSHPLPDNIQEEETFLSIKTNWNKKEKKYNEVFHKKDKNDVTICTIDHVDHGKSSLTASIAKIFSSSAKESAIVDKGKRNVIITTVTY
ncbi:hypothetical protein GQ457_08G011380 [Hibiscus cannabinus]